MNYNYPIIKQGMPYIIKFILYEMICVLTWLFSGDSFSLSINITMFLATVTIDMMILKDSCNLFKKTSVEKVQLAYVILLWVILSVSIVLTFVCSRNAQTYEENPLLFWALRIFAIPFGILSPIFELIYNIPLDN